MQMQERTKAAHKITTMARRHSGIFTPAASSAITGTATMTTKGAHQKKTPHAASVSMPGSQTVHDWHARPSRAGGSC